jgi:hypothetical protein
MVAGCEPVEYDPLDDATLADPYETYRALRDHDPVHRHEDPPFTRCRGSSTCGTRYAGPTSSRRPRA